MNKEKKYRYHTYCRNCGEKVIVRIPMAVTVTKYFSIAAEVCPNCGVALN